MTLTAPRQCGWCREPLDPAKRADSKFCNQSCRQAAHRFVTVVARDVRHDGSFPMRFAYADPPYPGMAWRYYGDHPDYAGEVDHELLIAQLSSPGRYDGWALSTSAAALPMVLSLCTAADVSVRVAAWVRGGRAHRDPRGPLSSWEPVVYSGGRDGSSRFDSLVHGVRPRRTDPKRVKGAKPAVFIRWLFELLGAQPGDELDDLFPGSGGVTRAWELFTSTEVLGDASPVAGTDTSCGSAVDGCDIAAKTSCGDVTRRASPASRDDASAVAAARHDTSRRAADNASFVARARCIA